MPLSWSDAGAVGSGNAYRHWYRHWYDLDAPHAEPWWQPYIVTAPDKAALNDRVRELDRKAGHDTPRISLPLRMRGPDGEHACVQLYRRCVLDAPLEGVIDNSMPLPRSGEGTEECAAPRFDTDNIDRVVAVIDSDIAFAHPRFRRGDVSAIAWFWDQDADAFDLARPVGDDRPTWFGRELDTQGIGEYVARYPHDERALYDAYRHESFVKPAFALPHSRFGHGTSVLDAAAGDLVAEDPKLAIFAVQLPRFAVGQTQGHFLEVYLRLALDRIATLADRIGEERKDGLRPEVYVNISVGGHAGRHDGQSRMERLMDRMIENGEVAAIFLPAGNARENRTHARFRGGDWSEGRELVWRILGDDGTPSFLEIWLPDDRGDVGLAITTPSGIVGEWEAGDLVPGRYHELSDRGHVLARLYVEDDPAPSVPAPSVARRRRLVVAIRHTSRVRKASHCCRDGRPELAGDWRIRLKTEGMTAEGPIETWVARDEQIFRHHTGGRQSFLPGSFGVTEEGTLSDLSTGERTIVVAAVRESDGEPADYSGEGFAKIDTVAGDRAIHPTVAAVADRSPSLPGLRTVGTFAGSRVRLSGTSIAAPMALNAYLKSAPNYGLKGAEDAKAAIMRLADPDRPLDDPGDRRVGRGRV